MSSNNYPKMDGKSNIYNGHSDDTYVTNLLFRQNNDIKVLNSKDEIREGSELLRKAKEVEENGFANLEELNRTTIRKTLD